MSDLESLSPVSLQQIYSLDDVHELLDCSERYIESLVDGCEEQRAACAHNVAQVWHHIAGYEEAHPQSSLYIQAWRQRVTSRLAIDKQLSHAEWLQSRNMSDQEQIKLAWGASIDEVLGELRPDRGFSKHVVEMVSRLSKRLTRGDAYQRLSDQVKRRASTPWAQGIQGMRRDRHLLPGDIRALEAAMVNEKESVQREQKNTSAKPSQREERGTGHMDVDEELAGVTMRKKRRLLQNEDRLYQAPHNGHARDQGARDIGVNGTGELDQRPITPTHQSGSSVGGSDRSIELGRGQSHRDHDEHEFSASPSTFGLDETPSSPNQASSPRLPEQQSLSLIQELDEDTSDLLTRSTAAIVPLSPCHHLPKPLPEPNPQLLEQQSKQASSFVNSNSMLATPDDTRTPSSPVSVPDETENTKTGRGILPCTDVKGALDTLQPKRMLSGTVIDLVLRLFSCGLQPSKRLYANPVLEPGPKLKRLQPEVMTVFVPVHHQSPDHWTLAEFDMTRRMIFHYDSLGPRDADSSATTSKKLRDFLLRVSDLSVENSVEDWSFHYAPGPMQTNAVDCGVHTLVTLLHRLCDLTPGIHNIDGSFWRQILISLLSKVPVPRISAPDKSASSSTPHSTSIASAVPNPQESIAQHWDTSLQAMNALHHSFQTTDSDICASQARLEGIEAARTLLDKLHGTLSAQQQEMDPAPAGIERDLENLDQQLIATRALATIPDRDRDALLSRLQLVRASSARQLQQSRSRLATLQEHMLSVDAATQTASNAAEALRAEIGEAKGQIRRMMQPLQSLAGALSGVAWRIGAEYAVDGG